MATKKVRRDGETVVIQIGVKSKAKTWDERAVELSQVIRQLQAGENAITVAKYESVLIHFLQEYQAALVEAIGSDLDIPVWALGRINGHIDNCKPLK